MDAVQIEETALPGIGLRHALLTSSGRRVGVVAHRSGRRDLVIFAIADPDACREVVAAT